ncbi:MAG: isoprenyl transferase [Pseudobdellovibrionaceae bacterium]|jgi:undecaprenyl diphosphate synthase
MNSLKHLAIIMDGNGRWAQLRGKPRTFGHIKGARVAKKIITEASDLGLEYLTLYAFSSENWSRPSTEVAFLMRLLKRYLTKETDNLIKKNIRFRAIGDLKKLPRDVFTMVESAQLKTSSCTGLTVSFAISYGSRHEIISAVQSLAEKVDSGELEPSQISEELLTQALSTYPAPDPDLVIRTSGEQRISNFLLWQIAYSEFYFSEVLWPDFTAADLRAALQDYQMRNRRFGAVRFSDEIPLS